MSNFETAIAESKRQMAEAFRLGGPFPFADDLRLIKNIEAGEANEAAVDAALANAGILPVGDEDLADLSDEVQQAGIDALAFYISFHSPCVLDGREMWGIFYIDHGVRQLAQRIQKDLVPTHSLLKDRGLAGNLALRILRRHEMFHFRFDVYALQAELTVRRPLYNAYHGSVYRKVFCTPDCYEESLANQACVSGNDWSRAIKDDRLLKSDCRQFIKRLCELGPPGYRDFTRAPSELRASLGGQLFRCAPAAPLDEPQASWVGYAGPYDRHANCPQYILVNSTAGPNGVPLVRLPRAGYIWQFHKNDPDPWPSTPHGHDYDQNAKLDLRSGNVYSPAKKSEGQVVDRLKAEALNGIRKWLEQKWPDVRLPAIELNT